MAPKIKVNIKNWTNDESPKNVNNWFQSEISQTSLGINNFSAVIRDKCLTINWSHPNASIVRELLMPVLKTIKKKQLQNIAKVSFISGIIDTDLELKDLESVSSSEFSSDPNMYPYSYHFKSLDIVLDSLFLRPQNTNSNEE